MQPSADNRTGYVVDLAGNIYELLRPPGSSVPAQSATIFLFLSLSFSLARFRFHFLALSLSARFCLSAGGPWSPRVRMCAGREVTRFAGNQHFRLRDRTGIHSRHGACIRAVISELRDLLAVSSAGLFINSGCRTPSCAHIGRASDSVSLRFTRNSISF